MWIKKGIKTNRIFTPLTSLKKEIRNQFITIDKEEIMELDIPCSQPNFLNKLLKTLNPFDYLKAYPTIQNQTNIKFELNRFDNLFKKDFYTFLLNEYNRRIKMNFFKIKRDKIKKYFMSWLFSNPLIMNKKITDIFKIHFPNILEIIINYKTKSKNSISCVLQNMEADVIYGTIVKQLFELKIKFFTVHDALYFKKSDYDKVNLIWDKTLAGTFA